LGKADAQVERNRRLVREGSLNIGLGLSKKNRGKISKNVKLEIYMERSLGEEGNLVIDLVKSQKTNRGKKWPKNFFQNLKSLKK